MFNWFKKKKVINEVVEPKVEKEFSYKDDWKLIQEDWDLYRTCHCGFRDETKDKNLKICPECGHTNKWEEVVGRFEYMYSPHRYIRNSIYSVPRIPEDKWEACEKDRKFVIWSEDKCQVN